MPKGKPAAAVRDADRCAVRFRREGAPVGPARVRPVPSAAWRRTTKLQEANASASPALEPVREDGIVQHEPQPDHGVIAAGADQEGVAAQVVHLEPVAMRKACRSNRTTQASCR